MNKYGIALKNVGFSFNKSSKPFFDNFTINFVQGQINFICGKNGIGKSTLLKVLSGQTDSFCHLNGLLKIDDQEYSLKLSDKILEHVAMVSQNFNSMLVDNYSFYENLQFALMPKYPSLYNLSDVQPLPAFVDKYKIVYDMPISLLSGGQRQILSILMTLQKSPRILLLDEPTAALDEENAMIVMDFLKNLAMQENITIIAIVHHQDLVQKYANTSYFELYQKDGVRSVQTISI